MTAYALQAALTLKGTLQPINYHLIPCFIKHCKRHPYCYIGSLQLKC